MLKKRKSVVSIFCATMLVMNVIPLQNVKASSVSYREKVKSYNTYLKSIRGVRLRTPFNKYARYFYSDELLSSTTENINIDVEAEDPNARIEIRGNDNLQPGENVIKVIVTAENEITKSEYVILVNKAESERLSSNADLKEITGIQVNETFHKDRVNYSADVFENVRYLSNLNYKTAHKDAQVYVTGIYDILKFGKNSIQIHVRAQDGTTKMYEIIVTKKGFRKEESNANLTGIYGIVLNETFDKNKTEYTATVSNEKTHVYNLYGITEDGGARLFIEDQYEPLKRGKNTRRLHVRAQDGTMKVYTIVITKGGVSSNANLTSIYGIKLNETFDKNKTEYSATVTNEISYLYEVNGIAEDSSARIWIEGAYKPLKEGINRVTLNVEAQDGTVKVYTIVITKEGVSSNANLTGIYGIELTEAFDKNKTKYSATVAYGVEYLYNLYGITEDGTAKVDLFMVDKDSEKRIENYLFLKEGKNVVKLRVQAKDKTVKEYTIVITREGPVEKLSSNANITSIKGIQLNETFHKDKLYYNAIVDRRVTDLNLTIETEDPSVSYVSIEGDYALKLGENVVKIKVYAQDGTSKLYILVVNRGNLSSNTNILSIKGVELNEDYSDDQHTYYAIVPFLTEKLDLEVETEDKNAVVILSKTTLDVGLNRIDIKVIAPDGSKRNVRITVQREENYASQSNADISLISGEFKLNTAFTSDQLKYSTTWGKDVNELEVTVENYAEIKISGVSANGKKLKGSLQSQYHGMRVFEIYNLSKGTNTLHIEVKVPSGKKKVYTFEIKK